MKKKDLFNSSKKLEGAEMLKITGGYGCARETDHNGPSEMLDNGPSTQIDNGDSRETDNGTSIWNDAGDSIFLDNIWP